MTEKQSSKTCLNLNFEAESMFNGDYITSEKHDGVVPYTVAEFRYVQENFLTKDVNTLQHVFDILSVWEIRSFNEVILVHLTKILVQGILYDRKYVENSEEENMDTVQNLHLIYGGALTRFMNYIDVICKHQGNCLKSMTDAAVHLGVNRDIVYTRHKFVHKKMPSLTELRETIYNCHMWLWEIHWSQPIEIALVALGVSTNQPQQIIQRRVDPINVKNAFAAFVNALKPSKSWEQIKTRRQNLLKLQLFTLKEPVYMVDAFVSSFVLTPPKLKLMGEARIDYENNRKCWKIPSKWIKFWAEVIEMFEACRVIGIVLETISKKISNSFSWSAKIQFASWINYFITRAAITDYRLSHTSVKIVSENMAKAGKYFNWEEILRVVNSLPKTEINLPNLNTIYNKANEMQEKPVIIVLDEEADQANQFLDEHNDKGDWALVSIPCALGMAPGQTTSTLNLMISPK